jgi:integrase
VRQINKLTPRAITKLTEPGRYTDGAGLELQVSKWGTRSWVFRYQIAHRVRYMGLGPLHTVTLAEAREAARQARLLILAGQDPLDTKHEARKARLKAQASRMTFKQCASEYIAEHEASWRSGKHAEQWRQSIERANRAFGYVDVSEIDTATVVKFLESIWERAPETASRTRGRIEQILAWATVREFRQGLNPARWRGHLEHLFKKVPPKMHLASMPYRDVPGFLVKLREHPGIAARALEFCILTASRAGEVNGARWEEIDGETWTRPADRTKAGRPHRVPLSARALAILDGLKRDGSGYVFPGVKAGTHINKHAMRTVLEALDGSNTVHGFRASFKTWAASRTNFPREVVEMALAHTSDELEAAYQRGDLSEKRARLMAAWASYCSAPMSEATVTPIRGTA